MKIAVIHNEGSVGSWRWVCAVFGAVKKYYPETKITVFCRKNVACPKDIMNVMQDLGFTISEVNFKKMKFINKKHNNIFAKLIDRFKRRKERQFIDTVNKNFDLAFNTWFYDTEVINFDIPYFIFTHYFGHHVGNVYNRSWWKDVRDRLQRYFHAGAIPCVTTNYVANELRRTFPEYSGDIHQVSVVVNNNMKQLSQPDVNKIMSGFEIKDDYILLATNNMHHKNSHAALTAYYYVKQKYPNLKMIIVGYGTDGVRVKMNCPYYADHVEENDDYDIKSLGLVSDLEINALIQNAKILLNVSLCEAACGSGMDAWFLGTPTAISDIPPYKEQVETLGVKTEFFNPKNSEDIAQSLLKLLDNQEYAKDNVRKSKEALKTVYTEKDMADNYMAVFKKYVK